ncbi:MAG: hypothetical protein DCF25_16055 [Leptolyngbya foveolarum]|uniref:Uncharacterized protein n=1 Tax=Leptolyngbya foveolarum TaxID=47253 RepID=A0A2W4W303_9CYAN|nr:MAG: hypothetical protein DCF25_16055 [Leptolyngbya foveolarum]
MVRRKSQTQDADVVDGEILSSTSLATQPVQQIVARPARGPRSSIGDGGYFDASGNRNPVFNITPRADDWSVFMVWRVYLSALRHHALKTMVGTVAILYGMTFLGSFGLNFLRGDVRRCTGDMWNPAIFGCNIAALLAPTSQSLAGDAHDLMLGEDSVKQAPIKSEPVIRAVRVDGAEL